jgi:hypothetical protein
MKNDRFQHRCAGITRRSFLVDTGMGFTGLALSAMLFRDGIARADSASPAWHPPEGRPHSPAKAKSVIWIFLCGGVSHVESFDVKPELNKFAGKSIEETPYKEVLDPKRVNANIIGANPSHGNRKVIMPLQTGYKEYGKSGLVVGDWFKNIGECSDDLAVVRSLWTIHNDHGAQLTWQTGRHPREASIRRWAPGSARMASVRSMTICRSIVPCSASRRGLLVAPLLMARRIWGRRWRGVRLNVDPKTASLHGSRRATALRARSRWRILVSGKLNHLGYRLSRRQKSSRASRHTSCTLSNADRRARNTAA